MLVKRQRGFSLVEMMVGLATSMFLLAGVMGMFSTTLSTQGSNLKQTRLNQELRNIMDLMARDIRRAGYWSLAAYASQPQGAITLSGTSGSITATSSAPAFANLDSTALVGRTLMTSYGAGTITARSNDYAVTLTVTRTFSQTWINEGGWMISNLFTETVNDLSISSDGTCIQYTYHRSDGSNASTVDTNEQFAFRLSNGIVQMYPGTGTLPNCSSGAGNWVDLSTDAINVTTLSFSSADTACINLNTGSACASPTSGQVLLYQREVDITLTGALASNSAITRTLTESTRLRNDVIRVQ